LSLCLLLCSVVLSGCGSEGKGLSPAPVPTSDAGATDVPTEVPDAPSDTPIPDVAVPVPRRTVVFRDPFGNYAASDNLLLDGDFEWASPWAGQYPWFVSGSAGPMSAPTIERGPACRSGINCARVQPSGGIAGFAVNPPEQATAVSVSLWVRLASASACPPVTVTLEGCFLTTEPQTLPEATEPMGADGWCHRAGVLATPPDKPCLFITAASAFGVLLVDDVVMTAAPKGAALVRGAAPGESHRELVGEMRGTAGRFRSVSIR